MRWSQFIIPTLKEDPQEAQIKSHRLMLRAGLVRKLASGTYSYLPLGLRALKKAEAIVREEMERAGALELLLPAIHPADLWRESGRYDILGEDMVHFKDRHGKLNVLGPTHEEVITDLARREIRSYKQLPLNLFQIQTKFRDEMRPRSGVIRSREFLMKDAYSFHADEGSLDETYRAMEETYRRIFTRCGLEFYIVEADPGAMGGSGSQEFVLFSGAGEDRVVQAGESGKVVGHDMAFRKLKGLKFPKGTPQAKPKKVHTPGHTSVEAVAKFLKKKSGDLVKTMLYEVPQGSGENAVIAVLVRGDHEVSEYKVKRLKPGAFLASRETIERTGSKFGFSGPVGLKGIPLYVDEDVLGMKNFVVGANQEAYHLTDVNLPDIAGADPKREIVVGDFRLVVGGDRAAGTGEPLLIKTAIELGHIFKLNHRYSEPMKAHFLDRNGKEQPLYMGCYGIGVNRILAAAIEQHADEKGIVWPKHVSPFQVLVTVVDPKDKKAQGLVEELLASKALRAKGVDLLVDDREVTAGIKFNDADLVGFPLRVILGPKNLKTGKAELKVRKTSEVLRVDTPSLEAEILKTLDKLN